MYKTINFIGGGRNLAYDAVAGIMILVVIIFHFVLPYQGPHGFYDFFDFFMPWFFFKSGVFHKKETKLNKATLIKLFKRLFVPLLIFYVLSAMYYLIEYALHHQGLGQEIFFMLINPFDFMEIANSSLWFLVALFFCNILFIPLAKLPIKKLVLVTLVLIVISDISMYGVEKHWHLIFNTITALMYCSLGYLSKSIKLNKTQTALCFAAFLALFIFVPASMEARFNMMRHGSPEVSLVSNLLGIMSFNYIFSYCKFLQFKPLVYIGQNSMAYYLLHIPLIWIVKDHFLIKLGPDFHDIYSLLACLFFIPIIIQLSRKFHIEWIIGALKLKK